MKGGGKMSGGKVDLDAAIVGVSDIGQGFQELEGSGDPMRHAAATRLKANEMQTGVNNLSGGGIASTSMTVDCPTVAGSSAQQQASSCALFKTSAETSIQTRLFNQGGGRRKHKSQRMIKRSNTKSSKTKRSNTKRSKTKRSKTKRSKTKRSKTKLSKTKRSKKSTRKKR
tara:strand:- start:906 stop:1415 length:510 start_codon:yes stop_codon:yes gene_type:complete